ncbi:MAG TPA: hypothetical protein VD790_00265 [Thermoleophilaceae bacterium]|nr:hypothetical protein [Thermoleophilaceae bacterium]
MIAALFGVGVLTGGGEDEPEREAEAAVPVEVVAKRVERIRGLEFERLPPVRNLSGEEAREEALAVLDEEYPPAQRAADERVLKLLGLLPDDADLRELAGSIFSEEIAGYYDERTGEMTVVEGSLSGDEAELTLAHELTHALEDQHFGLDSDESTLDDELSAQVALFEGTATVAMLDYLLPEGVRRRDALAQFDLIDLLGADTDLPPYLERSLVFPYSAGARFVDAIGTWGPANRALRSRPPLSTEQVIHPEKYRAGEEPEPVRVESPGPGWEEVSAGTIGEFDTVEILRASAGPLGAERAAAGWGGGAYALWARDDRRRLVVAWRWDTPRDAAEFVAALPRYVDETLDGERVEVDVGPTVRLTIDADE